VSPSACARDSCQPLSTAQLCAGLAAFPFVFAAVRASLYLLVAGLWMGHELSDASWVGLVVMFMTSVAAVACLGLLAGAVVLVYKRGEVLAGMLLFGMSLISGSVFPVSALPEWLEQIGSVMPLRFVFDGVRDALFTGSGWAGDALVLTGFSVIGLPLAVWAFDRALEAARRAGSIGQY
jgi:ABC-2 type transport system permease protein